MPLNYRTRLENLKARRYDPQLQKAVLSESFSRVSIPEDLKYLAESMMPIEPEYNDKTITAATNVKTHLERELKLAFARDYRHQGSLMTRTNIKTHSDIDLLTLINGYAYIEGPVQSPYAGNPKTDINDLYSQSISILKRHYDEVDDTGSKSISIFNKNLKRKVDIVPCYWYNTNLYDSSGNELERGVYLYDFAKGERTKIDYPFLHIRNVNFKGDATIDGSRMAVRLLKTLKADSEGAISLSSFELTTIIHQMDNASLVYYAGSELNIAENISAALKKLIEEPVYRAAIPSPNGKEKPLASVAEIQLKRLKTDLDELIADCRNELRNEYFEKAFKGYKL